jgi:hypothetical protein
MKKTKQKTEPNRGAQKAGIEFFYTFVMKNLGPQQAAAPKLVLYGLRDRFDLRFLHS